MLCHGKGGGYRLIKQPYNHTVELTEYAAVVFHETQKELRVMVDLITFLSEEQIYNCAVVPSCNVNSIKVKPLSNQPEINIGADL